MYFNKSSLSTETATTTVQMLHAALAMADELPIIFSLHEDLDKPTVAQKSITEEIIRMYLNNNNSVPKEYMSYIATALEYMLQELRAIMAFYSPYEEDNLDYIQRTYGILWSEYSDETVEACIDAFKQLDDVDEKLCNTVYVMLQEEMGLPDQTAEIISNKVRTVYNNLSKGV